MNLSISAELTRLALQMRTQQSSPESNSRYMEERLTRKVAAASGIVNGAAGLSERPGPARGLPGKLVLPVWRLGREKTFRPPLGPKLIWLCITSGLRDDFRQAGTKSVDLTGFTLLRDR